MSVMLSFLQEWKVKNNQTVFLYCSNSEEFCCSCPIFFCLGATFGNRVQVFDETYNCPQHEGQKHVHMDNVSWATEFSTKEETLRRLKLYTKLFLLEKQYISNCFDVNTNSSGVLAKLT